MALKKLRSSQVLHDFELEDSDGYSSEEEPVAVRISNQQDSTATSEDVSIIDENQTPPSTKRKRQSLALDVNWSHGEILSKLSSGALQVRE